MSRNSAVWEFFEVSAVDKSKAKCKLCNSLLSRGGKGTSSYNTSNLIKHLDKAHSEQWATVKLSRAERTQPLTSASSVQPGITAAFDALTPWIFDDERSRRLHRVIGEMIAIDNESFNVVHRTGLCGVTIKLSNYYLSNNALKGFAIISVFFLSEIGVIE